MTTRTKKSKSYREEKLPVGVREVTEHFVMIVSRDADNYKCLTVQDNHGVEIYLVGSFTNRQIKQLGQLLETAYSAGVVTLQSHLRELLGAARQ